MSADFCVRSLLAANTTSSAVKSSSLRGSLGAMRLHHQAHRHHLRRDSGDSRSSSSCTANDDAETTETSPPRFEPSAASALLLTGTPSMLAGAPPPRGATATASNAEEEEEESSNSLDDNNDDEDQVSAEGWRRQEEKEAESPEQWPHLAASGGSSMADLCELLKQRVSQDLGRIVDAMMSQLVQNLYSATQQQQQQQPFSMLTQSLPHQQTSLPPIFYPPLFMPPPPPPPPPMLPPHLLQQQQQQQQQHHHFAWPGAPAPLRIDTFAGAVDAAPAPDVDEETPKKKRAKITDIRCPAPVYATVSAAGAVPAAADCNSRASTPNLQRGSGRTVAAPPHHQMQQQQQQQQQEKLGEELKAFTLSPTHLRKAKLMFFYSRYPSTATLRLYFPDVQFNKSNTAQVVKWFSNFREFFYIQVEKFARQALQSCLHGDAAATPTSLDALIRVDEESEIYRVLNMHYNRSNRFQVPRHFAAVIETALREFAAALAARRDQDHSWKKPIYKVIARLDCSPPDCFRLANWAGYDQ